MPLRFDHPFWVFLASFALASFGGVATLLRSGKELTIRTVLAAFLYSGMIGLSIGLLWYHYFEGKGNIPFLLGVSALGGIGGANVLDLLKYALSDGKWKALIRRALNLDESPKEKEDEE